MSYYRVEFTTAAAQELKRLDPGIRRRVLSGVADLERDPHPSGCTKLVGETNAWRIRISDYRVLYEVMNDVLVVTVVRVAHHREV